MQVIVVGDMFGEVEALLGRWEGDGLMFDAGILGPCLELVVDGYAFPIQFLVVVASCSFVLQYSLVEVLLFYN
jgi:hypothetical protein